MISRTTGDGDGHKIASDLCVQVARVARPTRSTRTEKQDSRLRRDGGDGSLAAKTDTWSICVGPGRPGPRSLWESMYTVLAKSKMQALNRRQEKARAGI